MSNTYEGKICPRGHGTTRYKSSHTCVTCTRNRSAARRGDALGQHAAPEGFHIRGTSTLVREDGSVALRWVKTQIDADHRAQALLDAFATMTAEIEPVRRVDSPPSGDDSLLCVYPMGDPHIGMYAWVEECGESFDLAIAEANLCASVDRLVETAPPSERALIVNLGDFFHSDSSANRTARSNHALDVDTRWAKVLRTGVEVMCRTIDRALEKHARVTVDNVIGNHDDHSSQMLSICLAQRYRDNDRVEIVTSPSKFHYHRFGDVLIGTTHGDTCRPNQLESIMAHDRADDWGATKGNRYWYTGHVHHESVKEYPGCIVETFRTLAPRDAWHSAAGYRSGRDMRLDVMHSRYGLVDRHIVGIRRLRA